jgi:hypothetical protein
MANYSALAVYLVILSHIRVDLTSDVSQSDIMRETGIGSTNTVAKAAQTLESLGAVHIVEGNQGQGVVYEVLPMPGLPLPPAPATARKQRSAEHTKPLKYTASDGHVLRSVLELVVDVLLDAAHIPHVPEVSYSALFVDWEGKHVVDFVVAPKILIEVWAPHIPGYAETRKFKEGECQKRGINLLGVESFKDAIGLLQKVRNLRGDNWGGATLADLQKFVQVLNVAPQFVSACPMAVSLNERIAFLEQHPELAVTPNPAPIKPMRDPRAIRQVNTTAEMEQSELTIGQRLPEVADLVNRAKADTQRVLGSIESVQASLRQTKDDRQHLANAWVELKQAVKESSDAYYSVGVACGKVRTTAQTPEEKKAERAKLAEEDRKSNQQWVAWKFYSRVSMALEGKSDPYDARKKKELLISTIRTLVSGTFPERKDAVNGLNVNDVIRWAKEAIAEGGEPIDDAEDESTRECSDPEAQDQGLDSDSEEEMEEIPADEK